MHDARSAEVDAATKLLESDGVRQKLVAAADHARLLREEAQRKEENAFRAVADAERQFEAVGTEARRLAEEASLAQQAVDAAQAAERQCEVDWHEAGGVDPSSQTAAATAPPEPHIKASSEPETSTSTAESFDEEQAARDREAELAESVRRMQEIAREERLRESVRRMAAFAAEEKRRTEEAAAQKRQAAQEAKERVVREEQEQRLREEQEREERLARERWERQVQERKEREVREARKREEQERLERKKLDEARLRALVDATKKERARCLLRDSQLIGFAFLWSPPVAINRFKVINQEFDNIIFSDDHPFTFESAPWPHLGWPRSLKIEDIEWSSVEEFFTAVESSMPLPDYKDLVEKSHRRFHPDKWRARRLLQTVHDESLRDQLEKAGIAVSQALTPIWLESRKLR
jgi:chemotaxis protein histidine kinase CheA